MGATYRTHTTATLTVDWSEDEEIDVPISPGLEPYNADDVLVRVNEDGSRSVMWLTLDSDRDPSDIMEWDSVYHPGRGGCSPFAGWNEGEMSGPALRELAADLGPDSVFLVHRHDHGPWVTFSAESLTRAMVSAFSEEMFTPPDAEDVDYYGDEGAWQLAVSDALQQYADAFPYDAVLTLDDGYSADVDPSKVARDILKEWGQVMSGDVFCAVRVDISADGETFGDPDSVWSLVGYDESLAYLKSGDCI